MRLWYLCVVCALVMPAPAGESSPIAEQRAKIAFGPNANARLSLDIDASDNKMNDGHTSGTVAGAGTDVVVEVFITGLAGPIIGGEFSIATDMLTVKSAAATPGLSVLGTTATTVAFGGFPPGVTLSNGYLGTVTLTTTSDVTNVAFTVSASMNVGDGTNIGETDMLTAATPLTFNAGPTPDFDGDGMVGFSDFLEFAGQYGAQRGDGRYQVRYDLNGDGRIGFSDFLSFARSYGNTIPPTSGGGGGSPDLIVESVSVSESTLTSGQSFTLQVTVRNRGTWQSTTTTLEYYRSVDARISTTDREIGTDSISGLSASGTVSKLISLTAPSRPGTYYYGACVASVSGESNTTNNCSEGVRVTVEGSPDLIVESPSVDNTTPTPGQSLTLSATVRNQGTAEVAATTLRYYQSSDATITTDDTEVGKDAVPELAASATSEQSSSVTAPLTAGTYYYGACVASVSGESNTDNNCSTGVRVMVSSGGGTPKMYWTDNGTKKIQRANLDGSNVEDLITTGLWFPRGIALDVERGKMYWVNAHKHKIQRANLDGSNVEDLITELSAPRGIALDVGRGKMYWTDWGRNTIQRADLDGSNVEITRVAGLSYPGDIALDVERGKMYWTDSDTDKIQRANLDGSNVEDLIIFRTTGLSHVDCIALDVGRGKIYWTDRGTAKIQRANLDGSNVEDLITTGLSNPFGIALDVGRGKMYWTDGPYSDLDKIQRANLDGSNVEDLITTGLGEPSFIALDVEGR